MTRTDVHRPTALVATDYSYVAPELIKIEGLGDVHLLRQFREEIKAHMAGTGGTYSKHAHGGNCMVCGNARATYTILFYHAPTNSYVRMGEECARQVDGLAYDEPAMAKLRRTVKDARARKAGLAKAQATLEDLGLSAAWTAYLGWKQRLTDHDEALQAWYDARGDALEAAGIAPSSYPAVLNFEEAWEADGRPFPKHPTPSTPDLSTLVDLITGLIRYGSWSEKQVSFARSLLERVERQPEIDAQRALEAEQAEPAPTGRLEVEGEVLTVKTVEGFYGSQLKVLVKTTAGWKLWVTLPSALYDAQRGDTVAFTAAVEPSEDDPKFAFGKRPTKARFVARAA